MHHCNDWMPIDYIRVYFFTYIDLHHILRSVIGSEYISNFTLLILWNPNELIFSISKHEAFGGIIPSWGIEHFILYVDGYSWDISLSTDVAGKSKRYEVSYILAFFSFVIHATTDTPFAPSSNNSCSMSEHINFALMKFLFYLVCIKLMPNSGKTRTLSTIQFPNSTSPLF